MFIFTLYYIITTPLNSMTDLFQIILYLGLPILVFSLLYKTIKSRTSCENITLRRALCFWLVFLYIFFPIVEIIFVDAAVAGDSSGFGLFAFGLLFPFSFVSGIIMFFFVRRSLKKEFVLCHVDYTCETKFSKVIKVIILTLLVVLFFFIVFKNYILN